MRDDQGNPLPGATPTRVISLVPSVTEAIAVSAPGLLVGATEWCTHPAWLELPRYGGTKNPDVGGIVKARPDLVVVSEEENKPEHVAELRSHGIGVWVTDIRTVEGALDSFDRLLAVLDAPERGWLAESRQAWAGVEPGRRRTAVIPIWRRPWMAVGRDTFAGDVLRRLGVDNVLAGATERYPRIDLDQVCARAELVVLPDEPYRFTADDGPEAFPELPCALVDGRLLTWYGPAMVGAATALRRQLDHPLLPATAAVCEGTP